jgi:hypothetical protein
MKSFIYIFLSGIIVAFSACKGDGDAIDVDVDTIAIDTTLGIDTTDINPIDTVTVDSAGYINEDEALTGTIEKIYGEQWEFCDCVVKNDSVNTAIMDTDDDAMIDLILVRMEIIDQHCKEMLTTPNKTPEEREKHERKVKNCLRAAK